MKNVKNLIAQMTLEEKASLCSGLDFWYLKGIDRLGIPSIMVTDGPHGLRKAVGGGGEIGINDSVPATCFPPAVTLASTWNRDLVYAVGIALGEECREEKVGVILGPGANIKRSPLCGRNFEYFSEDPYLSGEMAKSHIKGVQSQGIGTSLKHYVANNQEFRRMVINAVIDERALREIYLAGYEIAVKGAQPQTLMCAYNRINDIYASDHKKLMRDILKEEWGHEGLVVTDWGAMNERVKALAAGTELEMPGVANGNDAKLVEAVRSGQLDEDVLDDSVERILTMIVQAEGTLSEEYTYNRQTHHSLARHVAGEGAVLLKNNDAVLPLQKETKIALIGRFAKTPRYQGAGSSLINPTRVDNLYDEIKKLVGVETIPYAPGYTKKGDHPEETLLEEAIVTAANADVVLICAGLTDRYEVEGLDRVDMKLPPGHDALIQRIAENHSSVVVILSHGSPVEMPWAASVSGILEEYLGGQAGAGAIAEILYGKINPSGKLAETFPHKLADNPSYHYFPGGPATVEYRESIYVGYRYYDTVAQEVLFPFGHGLSYTAFEYSDLQCSQRQLSNTDTLTVRAKVKNTGDRAGKEIIQLYVRDIESTPFRPDKELKAFTKIALQPGEERVVTFTLDQRAFAYYDVDLKAWHVEEGDFEILVGASSRDIRLQGNVKVTPERVATPQRNNELAAYHNFPKGTPISQKDFEALIGRPVPPNERSQKGEYTINTPVADMRETFLGWLLFKVIDRQVSKMISGIEETPTALLMTSMAQEMPLRGIFLVGGSITRETLEALLVMLNGQFFKGVRALIKAVRNR